MAIHVFTIKSRMHTRLTTHLAGSLGESAGGGGQNNNDGERITAKFTNTPFSKHSMHQSGILQNVVSRLCIQPAYVHTTANVMLPPLCTGKVNPVVYACGD
ncbi:hypothetical protein BaRGS_00039265 [Batillaria attramentaria]|uniref:Uncharacterized protein n=1 Tax=Batillaria attramentaria TaxID=370345 RepID=A0ABD0J4G2_9CAEN